MICLVDMEHERAVQRGAPCADREPGGRALHQAYCADLRRRLEEVANDACIIRRYPDVSPDWLDTAGIQALVLSGNVTVWDAYDESDLRPLQQVVRSVSLPILGLCGGLQFIAMTHGADVGPMRELGSGEEDVSPDYGSGYFKEWGFSPVRIVQSDPLFDGLTDPVFLQVHYWEVKSVPPGFDLLASSPACRVQVLRRAGALVYGTQFHPEAYVTKPSHRRNCLLQRVYPQGYQREEPDGRQLLANFFRAVGTFT